MYKIIDNSPDTKEWLNKNFLDHNLELKDWGPESDIEDAVNFMISKGWTPQGGIAVYDAGMTGFYQAMVKNA